MAGIIVQPQTLLAIGPSRQFGGLTNPPNTTNPAQGNGGQPIFKDYVTITENAIDALEITQQPVQQGAPISDHAFKKPISFSIQILFSKNMLSPLSKTYNQLLALQNSFQPFNVITPKRTYYNMLFASLGQTTDKNTENCLAINASFQQIITVPVGLTSVSRSQLKNAGSNGATQNAGQKTLASSLYQTFSPTTGLN